MISVPLVKVFQHGLARVLVSIDVTAMELDSCGIIYVFIGDCIAWCNKHFMWIQGYVIFFVNLLIFGKKKKP